MNLQTAEYTDIARHFLQRFAEVDPAILDRMVPYFEIRTFPKKTILLNEGEVENYLNLVVSGLVRKYLVSGKKEITLQLATEGHLIQSEASFHQQKPSKILVEVLEPTTFISLNYDSIQEMLETIPGAEKIARQLIGYMLLKKEERYHQQIQHSTRERFLEYLGHHPHMLQRVPQKILASYLNIKPETFSRLKHLVSKRSN